MNHTKDARRIGLVDVDGHNGFPNLALMRISAWHKALGDIGRVVGRDAAL